MTETREILAAAMEKHGLEIRSVFVPWSASRNKGEKDPSLNWKVTLRRRGRMAQTERECNGFDILTADYMAGCGHCPSYVPSFRPVSIDQRDAIRHECETGRQFVVGGYKGKPIRPDACDVLHSLLMDAEAIDCATFEEWADNFGYDADSRSAEATYRACLEIGLKLRAGLGDAALAELRDAARDY
jgi:hypothetical protein